MVFKETLRRRLCNVPPNAHAPPSNHGARPPSDKLDNHKGEIGNPSAWVTKACRDVEIRGGWQSAHGYGEPEQQPVTGGGAGSWQWVPDAGGSDPGWGGWRNW